MHSIIYAHSVQMHLFHHCATDISNEIENPPKKQVINVKSVVAA